MRRRRGKRRRRREGGEGDKEERSRERGGGGGKEEDKEKKKERRSASFEAAPIIECCYQISRAHRPTTTNTPSCSLMFTHVGWHTVVYIRRQWKNHQNPHWPALLLLNTAPPDYQQKEQFCSNQPPLSDRNVAARQIYKKRAAGQSKACLSKWPLTLSHSLMYNI